MEHLPERTPENATKLLVGLYAFAGLPKALGVMQAARYCVLRLADARPRGRHRGQGLW
jgi:hypothetical protein